MNLRTLIIVLLLFSYEVTNAQNFSNTDVSDLINMENLIGVSACQAYLNDELPGFVQDGMKQLKNDFELPQGENAILADFTCNINHLFFWSQKEKKVHYHVVKSYRASGGRGAVSNVKRSGGTPPGVHYIWKKQGEAEGWPLNYAIDGAKYGFRNQSVIPTQDDTFWHPKFVMTRILRLKGLEGPINNNSVARSILIHGTPEEGLLGYHESGGCIRMNNEEVIELYDQVDVGSLVNIVYSDAKLKIVKKNRRYLKKSEYSAHKLICVDSEKCKKY